MEGTKMAAARISGIETIFCGRFAFVEVKTDEGVTGIGECVCADKNIFESNIDALRNVLLGQNPFESEKLWRRMYGKIFFYSTATIMSAVDIALWDIKGKMLGVPCYELLGGKVHDPIRIYTHVQGAWNSFPDEKTDFVYYEEWGKDGNSIERIAENARQLIKAGYSCVKLDPFHPGRDGWPRYRKNDIHRSVECVQAVRNAIGDDADLIVEAHFKFDAALGMKIGKLLEPYDLLWFEDPVPAGQLKALCKVANHINVPIAAGERLFSKNEYKDYLEAGAIDVLMADIGKVGGLTEIKKISTLCEIYKVGFAPHNPFGPVSAVASAHICAASPAFLILEHETFIPWAIKPMIDIRNGYIRVPESPGLGIELDKDIIYEKNEKMEKLSIKGPAKWDREKLAPVF
jgi:galactonate dehydratase